MDVAERQQRLRDEFNQWAQRGRAASLRSHHQPLAERAIAALGLAPGGRVLDLGCGTGWACRLLAPQVGSDGLVVGLDIADAMIGEAVRAIQDEPLPTRNVRFIRGAAESIPWSNGYFSAIFGVESFYYCADQPAALAELYRIAAPGARLALALCLFAGSPNAETWPRQLAVPVELHTPGEYTHLLAAAGWRSPQARILTPAATDPHPDPHAHALLLTAVK